MNFFCDPSSVKGWLQLRTARQFGLATANATADVMFRYSQLAGRRSFELLDQNIYSPSNYNELDNVIAAWQSVVNDATAIHQYLPAAQQPSFGETVLYQATNAANLHQMYRAVTLNNLNGLEHRIPTNAWAKQALNYFNIYNSLLTRWNNFLDVRWAQFMDQTHIGYTYWQQSMRNTLPSLNYIQSQEVFLADPLSMSVEGSNATVPSDG